MFVAFVIVTAVTILANAGVAVADLARASFVVDNSTEVGVPLSWLPMLAVLKAAGAAGLLVGVAGVLLDHPLGRYLGVAAAIGLVLFFTGALVTHLRARVFHNIYFPGAFFLLAVASLVLALVQ